MIRHVVMWKLLDPADAPRFKQLLDTCIGLVPGMIEFEVGVRSAGLDANVDVLLVSSTQRDSRSGPSCELTALWCGWF